MRAATKGVDHRVEWRMMTDGLTGRYLKVKVWMMRFDVCRLIDCMLVLG